MFRDSVYWRGNCINQVERYADQVINQTYPFENVIFCLLEGDSADNTASQLYEFAEGANNIVIIHEKATFDSVASIDDPNRIKSMAKLGNKVLAELSPQCRYLIWLESDLIISPYLFEELLSSIKENGAAMVAPLPLIKMRGKDFLYDTWAFKEYNGGPYVPNLYSHPDIVQKEMSSVGTCAIIDCKYLTANFGDGAFPELCRQVRELGGKVMVDESIVVYHPSNGFIGGRWI